ncbi:hypothetical protein RAS1_14900 [Phycisphaerae bacterium RAS1]|nr:hypothetical protein RAS1_14900 [Phycisphaerae bacterium RAS1]
MGALVTCGDRGLIRRTIRWKDAGSLAPGEATSSTLPRAVHIGSPEVGYDQEPLLRGSWSADGCVAAAWCASTFDIVVIRDHAVITRVSGPTLPGHRYIAVSPDGRYVVGAYFGDGVVFVWDTDSGRLIATLSDEHEIDRVAYEFSVDGRWLLGSGVRGHTIWETTAWQVVQRSEFADAAIDGRRAGELLAGNTGLLREGAGRSLRLLDVETLEETAQLLLPAFLNQSSCFRPAGGWSAHPIIGNRGFVVWDLRRVRDQLAALGLDWSAPPLPPRPDNWNQRIEVHVQDDATTPQATAR